MKRRSLLLWNLSAEDADVTLSAFDTMGEAGAQTETLSLQASWAVAVNLQQFLHLAAGSSGAVSVNYPAGLRLIGQVVNRGKDVTSVALKDTVRETNWGYALSVRLADGLSTRFTLYNPNSSEVEVCLFLYFGEVRYTYPIKTLGPKEYTEIDLLQAQREMFADEFGRVIPADAQVGQAKIILHTGSVEKRLVVLGFLEQLPSGRKVVFQSCFECPPTIESFMAEPNPVEGFVGETKSVKARMNFSDLSSKLVWPHTLSSGNPSVATVVGDGSSSPLKLQLAGTGSTTATVGRFECSGWGFGPGDSTVCECLGTEEYQAPAQVQSYQVVIQVEAGKNFGSGAGFVVRSLSRTLTTNLTATVSGPGTPTIGFQWAVGSNLGFVGPSSSSGTSKTSNVSVKGTAASIQTSDTFVKVTATINTASQMASIPFTVREPKTIDVGENTTGGPNQTTVQTVWCRGGFTLHHDSQIYRS